MLGTPTDCDMVSLGHGDTLCGHPQPARLFNKPPEIAKYGKSQPRLIIHAGLNWLEARRGRRHSGGCRHQPASATRSPTWPARSLTRVRGRHARPSTIGCQLEDFPAAPAQTPSSTPALTERRLSCRAVILGPAFAFRSRRRVRVRQSRECAPEPRLRPPQHPWRTRQHDGSWAAALRRVHVRQRCWRAHGG